MSDESGNRGKNSSAIGTAILICMIVVLANADRDDFKACMPHGNEYWIFHVVYFVVTLAIIALVCCSGIVSTVRTGINDGS